MFARLAKIATAPAAALAANSSSGQLRGLGLTPEAIETNPIVYDLMMENVWRGVVGVKELDVWVERYAERRYGISQVANPAAHQSALQANRLLQYSVYNFHQETTDKQGTSGSLIAARPAMSIPKVSCCDVTNLYYNTSDVVHAWKLLVASAVQEPSLSSREPFLYDLVVCGVQALSNLALKLHANVVEAIQAHDVDSLDQVSSKFVAAARGANTLLATRKQFLLGNWIASAQAWAESPPPISGFCSNGNRTACGHPGITIHDCELLMCCWDEGSCFKSATTDYQLYERNAKTLVTLWGPYDTNLHEYSYRLWADLVGEFYVPRWVKWFQAVREAIVSGRNFNQTAFNNMITLWEEAWTVAPCNFTTQPQGDAIEISEKLLEAFF